MNKNVQNLFVDICSPFFKKKKKKTVSIESMTGPRGAAQQINMWVSDLILTLYYWPVYLDLHGLI